MAIFFARVLTPHPIGGRVVDAIAAGNLGLFILGQLCCGFGTRPADGSVSGHVASVFSRFSPRGLTATYCCAGARTVTVKHRGVWDML